jgi:type I restriction enzyme M protein
MPKVVRPLWAHFEHLYLRYEVTTVFDDMLSAAINYFTLPGVEGFSVDRFNKYSEKERKYFGLMLQDLIKMYHEEFMVKAWADPLGEFYLWLNSHSKRSGLGQFFTPEHVVDMMVMITGLEKGATGKNVNDPCCGSGRFLLSFHVNYPGNYMYGADIDHICCKMACLNMMLHGCQGEVIWMDSIKYEFFGGWKINPFIRELNGLPNILPASRDQLQFFQFERYPTKEKKDEEIRSGEQITLNFF